ncbi:Anti-anti-sigma regulatory factor (antagonist of anti-sigma factor) [Paracoccus tibetensis]|uniref:Anti-anti-sigma regulatory factor (Antagonist of anti-sigma factor) n=1 Tax=Paracoccus tibetensis TaxID=336292 RepID=A0A1G5J073_9RHOB|nr:Anti-anti-sigma regulatory factor (antagonist of anti-sigma factor) [Paracoccus tibetensis]
MPSLSLPEALDRTTVSAFASTLLASRGEALLLDASPLRRLSALGLEMLVSASKQWTDDGKEFRIDGWRDDVAGVLEQLGGNASMLNAERMS